MVTAHVDKVSGWGWAKVYIDGMKRGQGHLDGTYDHHVVCLPDNGVFVFTENVTVPNPSQLRRVRVFAYFRQFRLYSISLCGGGGWGWGGCGYGMRVWG